NRQATRLRELEDEYRAARDQWMRQLPEGELRTAIERDNHIPAEEIFRVGRLEYIPLILKAAQVKDRQADQQKISQILREKIMVPFNEQLRINQRLVKLATDQYNAMRTDAGNQVAAWNTANLVLSITALVLLVAANWVVARGIVRSTCQLNERM